MSTEARIYDESYEAEADLSALQYRFVKLGTTGVDVAGAGEACIGVLQNDPLEGRAAQVRHLGISLLTVNAASPNLAAGDPIESGANGIGVKSTADKKIRGAVALQAATADGALISVLLLGPYQSSL